MQDVVIFTALTWERRAAAAGLAGLEPGEQPHTWRGLLGDGGSCLVVQTGMGPARARAAAWMAPAARVFFVCGCAGALAGWLRAGDLVAADALLGLEDGRLGPRMPLDGTRLAAWGTSRGYSMHLGTVVSSSRVLEDPREKESAGADGALVVEMESLAVADVAASRGIPFLGLRVVLDEAGQQLPFAADVIDEATGQMRPVRVFASLIDPRRWPAAGRLARQTQVAERRLRDVLGTLLGEGSLAALVARSVAAGADAR